MKNLYHRNKGKVYPSSSSSSSSSSPTVLSPNGDALSVLNLLPTAILALASILSLEDREVLAYLITRSMNTPNPSSMMEEKNKHCKKPFNSHKPHLFNCGCFDCYTNYWYRWDSSPNRELIHQAIEAFEDHLTNGERSSKKNSNGRGGGKKRDKMSRRATEKTAVKIEEKIEISEELVPMFTEKEKNFVVPEDDVFPVGKSDTVDNVEENKEDYEKHRDEDVTGNLTKAMGTVQFPANNHKGLARKVLPDVLGLINSRLWSFWNPNI